MTTDADTTDLAVETVDLLLRSKYDETENRLGHAQILPKFWARYLDYTFVVIEQDQVLTFKECLNGVFSNIQFTMEEGESNQLVFLDDLVGRKECGGLKIKSPRDAETRTRPLSKIEQDPDSILQTLTAECQRLKNLNHDSAIVEQPSASFAATSVLAITYTKSMSPKKPRNSTFRKPPSACW
ncbi:unnamed protein product [Dibothriocephalus latus]|uniref:Uncharacterized protein n=1 Tax=Dibothriocephalus latus TaxID=60516 RepID=A0A3P6T5E0_DIBLA|nr:unnamed protein product [Dibothriocephalus latus]